jgi:hypothetical protein
MSNKYSLGLETSMELFGILIAGVIGLVASPLYCLFIEKVVARVNLLSRLLRWISTVIIVLLITEICIVLMYGPLEARRLVGRWFFSIHSALSITIAPALGAFLLLLKSRTRLLTWYLVAAICWITGMAAILYQFFIAESLYGIDGRGGPYTWPW